MKKYKLIILFLAIVLTSFALVSLKINIRDRENLSSKANMPIENSMIKILDLKSGQKISSPFKVEGQARGPWFFEGVFPVHVEDSLGNSLGFAMAEAKGGFMTEEFVPFEVEIFFTVPENTKDGKIVFLRDSGKETPGSEKLEVKVSF